MPSEKAPAFQFYPKDFLTDENVCLMSYTEIGIYAVLMSKCWLERSLPADTSELAKLAKLPSGRFGKLWEGPLSRCFYQGTDGRFYHKRLDEEREKQAVFRRRQSDAGRLGGRPRKAVAKSEESQTKATLSSDESQTLTKKSSPISYLPSASSSPSETQSRGRGGPPLALGLRRFKVWRWMLDDCIGALGPHADGFDLHGWLHALDASETRVIPQTWPWLKDELLAEAARRGLPIAASAPSAMGKQTSRLGSALASIKAAEGS